VQIKVPKMDGCGKRPLKSIVRSYPYTFCDGLAVRDDPTCPPDYALCGIKLNITEPRISGNNALIFNIFSRYFETHLIEDEPTLRHFDEMRTILKNFRDIDLRTVQDTCSWFGQNETTV
jgi:hypothetical protein